MKKKWGNSLWEFMKDFTEKQILGEKSPSTEGEDVCSRLREDNG